MSVIIHPYLKPLLERFTAHADPVNAAAQQRYMKNRFDFFGIKTPQRRLLMREFLKVHGRPGIAQLKPVVRSAFAQPQREFHYAGMELFTHAARKLGMEYLPFAEELILTQSWWDTVDHLAVHGVGCIMLRHPDRIPAINERFLESNELWLLRTALIFQLQYKERTDVGILFGNIQQLAGHSDFFIRKGIGWALRQYAYTDPEAVIEFVKNEKLPPLSVREALKNIL